MLFETKDDYGQYSGGTVQFFEQLDVYTAKGFSSVAIIEGNQIAFTITLLLTSQDAYNDIKRFQQCDGVYGEINAIINAATFTNIVSKYMVRIFLLPSNGDRGELVLSKEEKPPLCFVKGKPKLKEDIKFLGRDNLTREA